MPNKMSTGVKKVLRVIGAYIVTLVAVIFIMAIFIIVLIDRSNCYAMGPSLLALWCTTAGVFLVSSIVVGAVAFKIIPSTIGRLVTVVVYGVSAMVNYVGIAFGI